MSKWLALQIAGMVILTVGVHGLIRVLIDHANRGLVSWMPGGFAGALTADVVLIVLGGALAWLGEARRG
ncbi:hypothetical protein nbrc107696_22020 [Gordonia spumicola]|uniref:Uncharacterized protein n=1 Tax=Gordonia spumicola TaxID=589161 RepID=A0A7I9V8P2_9ACTN|nr:hypothetical protein [Gordonia spumicola]GEE01756.1 hypothetical protein nbrc107696_22020 [Gordonia spumicola]